MHRRKPDGVGVEHRAAAVVWKSVAVDIYGIDVAGALRNTFLMTGVASLILGVFSFTLPKTPPRGNASKLISTAVSQRIVLGS